MQTRTLGWTWTRNHRSTQTRGYCLANCTTKDSTMDSLTSLAVPAAHPHGMTGPARQHFPIRR